MKIYRKLYLWFLLVFILTIAIVSVMVHEFYTERVRDELQNQLQSHARFLLEQYEDECSVKNSESCRRVLRRLEQIQLRFWIVNQNGEVVLSNQKSGIPAMRHQDLVKARKGESVISMRHRGPQYVIVPLKTSSGFGRELVVVERSFPRGRFPRFPVLLSFLVVLVTIAVLIFPLSKRLTKPLRQLHELGQEWAEGRLEKRATIRRGDEIGQLAGTFNTMADNLQKMLTQRQEFQASISHELKSPLARMRIALELLRESGVNQADTPKLLANIEQEIAESEKLVDQLLVLSRVQMNVPSSKEKVELEKLTKEAIRQIQPLADRASVKFELKGTATALVDYSQMERAMLNVIENAVKFSPAGALIQIHMEQNGNVVLWRCSDQGPGLDPSELEMIFEPFYRGKNGLEKEGTGLGLFIAKRILEMHGGKIRALNSTGAGVTIEVELPAA